MTISSTTRRITYAGNDVAVAFAVPFPFFAEADLKVSTLDDVTLTSVTLELDTDYTVSGAEAISGGVVTMGVAPETGTTLVIERILSPIQSSNFHNQGEIFPEVIESALDYQIEVSQQFEDLLGSADDTKTRVMKLIPNGTDGSSAYDARSNRIQGLDDPTAIQDAATKAYVDFAVVNGVGGVSGTIFNVRQAHLFATSGIGTEGNPWVTAGSNPIQAALTSLPVGGGTVYMVPGFYAMGNAAIAVTIAEPTPSSAPAAISSF